MQLIGMLDSPYVRRVAITARFLGIEFEHNPLSIFRTYEEFRRINPLVKVPTLVCDDGEMLVDSSLIIDYFESLGSTGRKLMPAGIAERRRALQILATAFVAMEKVAQLIYETRQRPAELQYEAWVTRLEQQLTSAVRQLERDVGDGSAWFFGSDVSQADISVAVAWSFIQNVFPELVRAADYPGMVAFTRRAEALPEFVATPING
jgi:glutathione S-transferase